MIPSLKFNSLAPLKAQMDRLSAQAQGRIGRNATMAAARLAAKHARVYVPVKTGRLKASIKARRGRNPALRGQAVAFANAAARHAWLVEYGTAHSEAHSFIRKAVDNHGPEIQAKMAEIIARGLTRELRKLGQDPEDVGEL